MKAVQLEKFEGIDKLLIRDVPKSKPSQKEVLVRTAVAGLNFIDIYQRKDFYPLPLPFTPGLEGSWTVEEIGDKVSNFQAGDRVDFAPFPGSYAEYTNVPEEKLIKLPNEINSTEAATLLLQGMTAHYLAFEAYSIKKEDTVLIHAGAGGVGRLLTQIAKNVGATVITTSSSKE